MSFIDRVQIELSSGQGGAGAVHFHSNRQSRRAGPDGGDGGKGGDLIITPLSSLFDLSHLKSGILYKAEDGQAGKAGKKKGANGKNLSLRVPFNTVCYNMKGDVLHEIQERPWTILLGGRGGKGNVFFKTSRFQAPKIAQTGEPARRKNIILELKWKSTACLIGLRGSGKTSLVFHLSDRWGKDKLYPSLKPRLFSVKSSKFFHSSMVLVDLPGISTSTVRFLKQAERSKVILFIISVSDSNPFESYQILQRELRKYDKNYNSRLMGKKSIVILTGSRSSLKKMKPFQDKQVRHISFFCSDNKPQKEMLIREIFSIVTS